MTLRPIITNSLPSVPQLTRMRIFSGFAPDSVTRYLRCSKQSVKDEQAVCRTVGIPGTGIYYTSFDGYHTGVHSGGAHQGGGRSGLPLPLVLPVAALLCWWQCLGEESPGQFSYLTLTRPC